MDEFSVDRRSKGQLASLAAKHAKPYIDELRKHTIEGLMVEYRQGKLEHNALLARVAALCVLEDLENKLKQDIRRGEHAAKEIEDANPAT